MVTLQDVLDIDYDRSDGEITITFDDSLPQVDEEQVHDIVGNFITGDASIDTVYEDENNVFTVSLSGTIAIDSFEHTDGQSLVGVNTGMIVPDDINVDFGTDNDISLRYVSGQGKVQFYENNINGDPVLDIHGDRHVKAPGYFHTRRLRGINGGEIDVQTTLQADSIRVNNDPGVEFDPSADPVIHILSTGDIDARGSNFQFVDDDGQLNRIAWSRDSDGNALRVWDIDNSKSLFRITDEGGVVQPPTDVRSIANPETGMRAYHDGTGTDNTEGPAHYTSGGSWVSTVDNTTIS